MSKNLKVFISIIFFSILCQVGYAQIKDTAKKVEVTLHIVGEGISKYYRNDTTSGYFATVTNICDTTIRFYIMSCNWSSSNWIPGNIPGNNSYFLDNTECDHNIPERITLLPHKAIHFYGIIRRFQGHPYSKTIKLGFVYFSKRKT